MSKIRIGFIGVGQIAKYHLKQYADVPDVEIVAACDIDEKELEKVCNQYNIPNRYTDFRKLIARDDLDAVDVCLHNNLHSPATIETLKAGKHVYCEKPIAGSYHDGEEMLKASRECKKMLHIQLGTLYSKEAKAAKRLIDTGQLGKIYHGHSAGHRRRGRPFVDGYGTDRFVKKELAGGGALFDMAIYHIGQILHLMGRPPIERISGQTYQETDMDPGRRESSGYNVEELAMGFVTFKGGMTMSIIESWAVHLDSFGSSYVLGSKGGVKMDPFRYFTNVSDMVVDSEFDLDHEEFRFHALDKNYSAYDSSIKHWVAALQGRVPLLPTAEIALDTMLIQEGIYTSVKEGKELLAADLAKKSKSSAVKL